MDKYLGKKLEGRYEVMEIIGIGGMANVYKAYDVLENRVVAVKILQEEHMNNEDMRRRFKNESKAMATFTLGTKLPVRVFICIGKDCETEQLF